MIDKYDLKMVEEWMDLYLKPVQTNDSQKIKEINAKYLISKLESKFMSDFSDEVIQDFKTTIFPDYISLKDYNLLNIAILKGNNLLFDWCIKKGFNPDFISTTGNYSANTEQSIVLSAYEGNIYALNKLIKIGVNPVVIFQSKSSINLKLRGGTLLHQVMSRYSIENKEEVVKILSNAYPDLTIKDYEGKSVLDVSVDNIGVDYIKEKIAKNEKKSLDEIISANFINNTVIKKRL